MIVLYIVKQSNVEKYCSRCQGDDRMDSHSTDFVFVVLRTNMLISYKPYIGIVTNMSVKMSGGVIMAATIIIIMNAYDRYFFNVPTSINPIFPSTKAMTGSWNTIPIKNVKVVNVEI